MWPQRASVSTSVKWAIVAAHLQGGVRCLDACKLSGVWHVQAHFCYTGGFPAPSVPRILALKSELVSLEYVRRLLGTLPEADGFLAGSRSPSPEPLPVAGSSAWTWGDSKEADQGQLGTTCQGQGAGTAGWCGPREPWCQ